MTIKAEQFPFVSHSPSLIPSSYLPFLPTTLALGQRIVQIAGLIDTAATVNVLPYSVGQQLGAKWDDQTVQIQLTGNLANEEARGLVLMGTVSRFPSVRLAFAWTRSDAVPVILGEVNLLMEFDVCFYRSRLAFEIKPKN